jgi:DNA-directed RNA polymerase subunit M/transcription elongation factor TFIIS
MYRDMNNCMECGRLVAPSSGLRGADTDNLFCCRKCLRAYYDNQPGLWEQEEENARELAEAYEHHLMEEEERQRQIDLENDKKRIEQKEKDDQILINKVTLYIIFFIFVICLLRSCH